MDYRCLAYFDPKKYILKPKLTAEPNLLGDLLKRQNEFLKPADRSTFELKEPAHQKEVGIGKLYIQSLINTD